MPPVQFAIQSYQSRSLELSAQRLVNFYAEAAPQDAKSPVVLYGTPGIKSFATATNGQPSRGRHVMGGILYVVNGNTLYSITTTGTVTSLGTINTNRGRVGMAHNAATPAQLCIVDGVDGWIYDTTNGLQQITDADFVAADDVWFVDSYFAFNEVGTGRWFISNSNDGLTYTGTDFATAEGDPDNLVSLITDHREVWLFGTTTTEVWINTGAAGFTFERNASAFIERGCLAKHTPAKADNSVFWPGEDRIVYRAAGFTPVRISTHAVEEAFREYDPEDSFGFSYTQAGHIFYGLTFPRAPATWVFDVTTGLWHERESRGLGHWRATPPVLLGDKLIVGDTENGNYGELDLDTYNEYGDEVTRTATAPPSSGEGNRVFFPRFELDVEGGQGLTTGQGSDPQVWLDWSDDGGKTWSMPAPALSAGKIGEYKTRLRWHRLGSAWDRVFRVGMSDPVRWSIVGANMEART